MNIPLDATAELPEEQKKALLQSIEKSQIRDRFITVVGVIRPMLGSKALWSSMRMYNSLVERCFDHCVESFRSKSLDSSEERVGVVAVEGKVCSLCLQCVRNCCGKFLAHSGRIGTRFAELSAEMEKQQMEQLKKMQKEMK